MPLSRSLLARCSSLLLVLLCVGCAGVKVSSVSTRDYVTQRRGDVLTTGRLSAAADEAIAVLGLEMNGCRKAQPACIDDVRRNDGLDDERRLATLSELWLLRALTLERSSPSDAAQRDAMFDAYLQSARYAYAYLFFTARPPSARAFEDRQSQVRDYYNFAVQQSTNVLFERYRDTARIVDNTGYIQVGDWHLRAVMDDLRLRGGEIQPKELIPASTLTFQGLRSMYRRDGFGAELVAVMAASVNERLTFESAYSETPFPALTVILTFRGNTLQEVLETHRATLTVYDPYRRYEVPLGGVSVPLAANFTSGYGLWLARSGFATQALRNALGSEDSLDAPHIYLLQPYDPKRRIVVMLHGLASSPEAWINLANEVLGDEVLRRNYQIWQVYYPTNAPIPHNNAEIRKALRQTLNHFDPDRAAQASQDMVIIGHSMGGVLSRLMVSSSGNLLWDALQEKHRLSPDQLAQAQADFGDMMRFEPFNGISRAVFIAAPHRGTEFAENRLARWVSNLITLPATVLRKFSQLTQSPDGAQAPSSEPLYLPTGIDNLSQSDPFITLSASMPISPAVRYHSIIANNTPRLPLTESSDGLVPYRSAHLEGAASELVIPYSHSVQETPKAILEIRRILHQHVGQTP